MLSGERKPTKMHGTEIGPAVFEGTLSRPSESTVVTKYLNVPQLAFVSVKVSGFGRGNGVPVTVTVAKAGLLNAAPLTER